MRTKELELLLDSIATVAKLVNKYYDTLVEEGMLEDMAFEMALELQANLILGGMLNAKS